MRNLNRLFFLLLCLTMFWAPSVFFAWYNHWFYFGIDIPSMFCVFFPSLIHLALLHHPRKLVHAVKHLFSEGKENVESLQNSLQIWSRWGSLLVAWGVAMTSWSVWQMSRNISDPNSIIPSIQLGFLSMQYGALFALLFTFLPHYVIEQRLITAMRAKPE
ncbi:hypothetical protein K8I31_10085 [bacterium]|nr:hypothetical protein [bacterium]